MSSRMLPSSCVCVCVRCPFSAPTQFGELSSGELHDLARSMPCINVAAGEVITRARTALRSRQLRPLPVVCP
jgi:hypothetical protein